MQEMLKNMDFYVTPVLNIDGYIYSWKDNTVSAYGFFLLLFVQTQIQLPFEGFLSRGSRATDERDNARTAVN